MNVLVIGNGAREHAMCWKLRSSRELTALYCAPGNPGTERVAQNVPIAMDDIVGLAEFARSRKIDLTIVGPELPLSLGISDAFAARGLRIFGPSQEAARIEASKSFAKEVMQGAGVSTAACKVFSDRQSAEAYLAKVQPPIVLKADGLAAGKGVFVCLSRSDVAEGLEQLFGVLKIQRMVAEDYMSGHEVSYIVATDGERVVPLASSHDYKRLLDNHEGPNTGGMGSVSPTPSLSPELEKRALSEVIYPVLAEMRRRGAPFRGFLYAGLMVGEEGGIKVLEFNARLGDPETQVIMRRMEGDFLELCHALSDPAGKAPLPPMTWSSDAAVCIVAASAGYPGTVQQGDEITGIEFGEMLPQGAVFYAGIKRNDAGKLVTSGGRVLSATATGATVAEAASRAYKVCDMIQFKGRQVRRDIGR
jgi:phosphoribosylamine--glycine ligase